MRFDRRLSDPLDIRVDSDSQGMALGLANAVVEFKHFHPFAALYLALHSMFIKGQFTVRDILLGLQQNVEQLCLQTGGTSQHELRRLHRGQDVRVFVPIWDRAHSTSFG